MPQKISSQLKLVGPRNRFPKVTLQAPSNAGFLFLGLSVDRRLPFLWAFESAEKQKILSELKRFTKRLLGRDDVQDATVFKALFTPPGRGVYLKKRPEIEIARFDIVLLVRFNRQSDAQAFTQSTTWKALQKELSGRGRTQLWLTLSNARAIGPVDHSRDGVFLFNYFYAENLDRNLAVWDYTAGWFQDQTGLDNSTLLLPDEAGLCDYKIINHCRWDRLWDILPSLIFKPSFRRFVLANFEANATAPIPILYRLA